MKIRTKLNLIIWPCAAVLLLTTGVVYFEFAKGQREEAEAETADDIAAGMAQLDQLVSGLILEDRAIPERQILEAYDQVALSLRTELFAYPEEREVIDSLREKYRSLGTELRSTIAAQSRADSLKEPPAGGRHEPTRLFGLYLVESEEMSGDARSMGRSIRAEMTESHERVRRLLVYLALIVVAAMFASSHLLGRTIAAPLVRLREGVAIIGTGNLLHTVGTRSNDETGLLSREFDRMTENLRRITTSRDELDRDVQQRLRVEEELRKSLSDLAAGHEELKRTLSEVRTLRGILPICSACKKIRDDKGYWEHVESYVGAHSDALFSHGMCPDCMKKWYPEYPEEENQHER